MAINVSGIQESTIQRLREELAAVFRWTARIGMHESVANHFSVAVNESGSQFLINPNGRHFANMRASDLMLLDAEDDDTMSRPDAPDATAWAIHSGIHRNVPAARCVLHLHPHYATALASLEDSSMLPVDQNTMRFYNRYTVDDGFGGMGLGGEATRLSGLLSEHPVLLMGNHGVTTIGDTVAMAFGQMYYFEKACRNYITALSTGQTLRVADHETAELTAVQWEQFIEPLATGHLREIREILDREQPEYKS
jgi:ribulose-5-phosphate 4-epimerase/fuculose-1-phosphate aldolase